MEEDQMDIDPIVEIPDTPERFSKQGINGRSSVRVESNHSPLPFRGKQKIFEEGSRDQPMIIDSGSRGRPLHPPKRTNSPSNSRHSASLSLGNSLSSRNGGLFRKGVSERNPRYLNPDFKNKEHVESMRPPSTNKSSSQCDGIIDLTKRNLHIPVTENASTSGMPGNNRGDFRKGSGLANGASSHSMKNFPISSSNGNEGTSIRRVGSSICLGERVGSDNKEPGNGGFLSLDPVASPRVNRQKRLVRNGCISPNNVAKAKQLVGKDVNCPVAVVHNNGSVASSTSPVSPDIRELVAEDSDFHTRKGKGVISLPYSSKGPEGNKNLNNGGSTKSIDDSGGWRSTHNLTREINMPPDEGHCLFMERDAARYPIRHGNSLARREIGTGVATGENPSLIPSEHVLPLRGPVSQPRTRLGRLNGACSAVDSFIKRQKQGSTSSNRGECSTSVAEDVVISSSGEAGNSKSTSSNVDRLQNIIEVDEVSPQSRQNARDEDVRARQLEADELLARELQEQFYNETPVFGEVDEHIALGVQHQEGPSHGSSRARRPVPDAQRLMPNLHRPPHSRSSSNAPRRGAAARAAAFGRMTRQRSRFPGQPRTLLPSRGRNSMFPPDMDIDMRMHILGALEEFSDMGMNAGILQADRDFNEDDYEMLLALDENNHQHGGASVHQINGLPQSTVQNDNFEEACAICLDTPAIGETIRHLPCLHKFHKVCIDTWLRRKTSCPVCKSSIT